jgi:putative flippase GtrA
MMPAGSATSALRVRDTSDEHAPADGERSGGTLVPWAGARADAIPRVDPSPPADRSRGRLRFARFALVGIANTAVTFAVFNLCTALLHLPPAEANVIGWVAGFANSFVWNRSWTFGDQRHLHLRRVLPRFAIASLVALAVSEGVLVGLHAAVLSSRFAELLPRAVMLNGIEAAAIVCSLGVSYALSARWAFRKA